MEIKEILASNLIKYRKLSNLTQAELADKLNYSDKAISKWERGEAAPDIFVLKNIADFYGIKIDTLLSEQEEEIIKPHKNLAKRRTFLSIASTSIVWLVAILYFSLINLIVPSIKHSWLSFIYAVPATCILLLIFAVVWKKNLVNFIIITILTWTSLLAIFLTLKFVLFSIPSKLWMLFLIGAPIQILFIFSFLYKKAK